MLADTRAGAEYVICHMYRCLVAVHIITGALSLAFREVESQRQLFSKIPFLRNLSVAAQRAKEEQKQNEDEDHADNKGCVTRAGRLRYR